MSDDHLYSAEFDDVYFSRGGGLDETRHVFLAGNDLPRRWQESEANSFTIAETGFGTGLNFLAAWTLFEETARVDQHLHFISFERYPLTPDVIARALAPWREIFGARFDLYLKHYPLRLSGFHRVALSPRVTLILVFDDVNDALPQLVVPRGVDAWFLDGFTPAKNPQMWTDGVFQNMARLSAPGATFATFTAAGFVRRGLAAEGFDVEKRPGFGHKRDMSVGALAIERAVEKEPLPLGGPARVAIIGGGLAGTACGYSLARRGVEAVIFDAADRLGAGASGNRIGMMNPRLYAQRSAEADFYASAYAMTGRVLKDFPAAVQFNPCGSLHLLTGADKDKRLVALGEHGEWPAENARLVDADEASALAGVALNHGALWLPDAGTANPAALCAAYAAGCDVRLNTPLNTLVQSDAGGWLVNGEAFDAVILACGTGVLQMPQTADLPVHGVRGQVSWIAEQAGTASAPLACNICYGGYITPAQDGVHVVGSTFQKWLDHTDVLDEDDAANLDKLANYVPDMARDAVLKGGQAGLRTASQDRVPLIGAVPDQAAWQRGEDTMFPGLYVSTGHGSHGVVSSLAGAEILADMIIGAPHSQPQAVIEVLSPARFLHRARRKGRL